MRKRLIKHGIAVIGIAVLAFLAIGSVSNPVTIRDDYKVPEKKNWDENITEYTNQINNNPSSDAYNNRGVSYYYNGQYNLAIADFEAALRLDSSNSNARDNLAKARQKAPSSVQVASSPAQNNSPSPAPNPAQIVPAQTVPAPDIPAAQGNNLAEKFAWLQVFAQSNNSYLLEVNANENIPAQTLSYSGKSNITLTLWGVGANRTISSGGLEVSSGVTLVLDNNITLQGRGVAIRSGGTLIMNTGSTITGINGNGVYLNGGTFTMNGGTISGNGNSGVRSDGTFTMNGGTISGNTANDGGGVYVVYGTFTMNGGTISGNTVPDRNGVGGGVYVAWDNYIKRGGTFTMNGGTISGNTTGGSGGGVYVSDGTTFTMSGGTISGNTARSTNLYSGGGGVYVRGTFSMSNGTISGNTSMVNGGGVYVVIQKTTFTKTGGTITGYTGDTVNGNAVKNSSGAIQNYKGHAVYAVVGIEFKIRESTAGPGDNLLYDGTKNPVTASGAWDN